MQKKYTSINTEDEFLLFKSNSDVELEEENVIANVAMKNKGLTVDCDYINLKNSIIKETKKWVAIENRPFQAATFSHFKYDLAYEISNKSIKVIIETYFDCENSYFVPSDEDHEVWDHEQLHFDISEIYARKFAAEIKMEITTVNDIQNKHKKIAAKIEK